MVYGADMEIALLEELSVHFRNAEFGIDQAHCGYSSKAHDDLRADKLYLLAKILYTYILLLGQRIAVIGRAAF